MKLSNGFNGEGHTEDLGVSLTLPPVIGLCAQEISPQDPCRAFVEKGMS